MFIEQYKLDRNPFAEDSVRPLFVSQSMREVSTLIRKVGECKIQTAVIAGVAGVGKTTLLTQRVRGFKKYALSWINPDIDTPQKLLEKLLQEIGPGPVEGDPVPGLGQLWYAGGNPGNKAGVDAIFDNDDPIVAENVYHLDMFNITQIGVTNPTLDFDAESRSIHLTGFFDFFQFDQQVDLETEGNFVTISDFGPTKFNEDIALEQMTDVSTDEM